MLVIKSIAIGFSSFAAVLTICQSASAQLNIGRYGIQPGLEQNYLQYQLSGQPLKEMQGIPRCTIGFGLSCNKTGAVLEQLLESNNGPSYQDLILRAAGGVENSRNFASFYGNNSNVFAAPYASFWRNDSAKIVDGSGHLLGGPVSRTPVKGLGLVTRNFYWAPLSAPNNALSPRSGLLNLKYSYGRLLFEEVSKIPNFKQQIQSLDLPPEMKKFYLGNFSRGLNALNRGNERQLQQSILNVLSAPYSPGSGEFGRPALGIPEGFDRLVGQGLSGDSFLGPIPVALAGEVLDLEIPSLMAGEVFVQEGSRNGFPIWPLGVAGGIGLLALLLSLGGDGDDDSSSRRPGGTDTPDVSNEPVPISEIPPDGDNGTPDYNQVIEIPPITVTPQPGQEVKEVPEPPIVSPLLLLIVLLYMLNHKQRHTQTRG